MHEPTLTGANYIHGSPSTRGRANLQAEDRIAGSLLEPSFFEATADEVRAAAASAAEAFPDYAATQPAARAAFLDRIAERIEAQGDELLDRAHRETALSLARLAGERGRTCNQLRLFANLLREGSWVDARIDTADPNRVAGPKPDLRRMLVPIGPVVVFGASNFPLAFSVAGGDTASALAAGCPVVVKAHPSHPGTSEGTARAVIAAAAECGLPPGVFGLIHGGVEVGSALVASPEIEAVAFTGSKAAGRAIYDLAASRARPIPVYAEMGSVNPLFVLPGALDERMQALAQGYADSLTLGVGQFCTNPGIVVGLRSGSFDAFLDEAARRLRETAPGVMLNSGIASRYSEGVRSRGEDGRLRPCCCPPDGNGPALFAVGAEEFLRSPELAEELFGPAGVAVACDSPEQMLEVAKALEGQLTATVHFSQSDREAVRTLLPLLTRMAGRVLANGFPTGVEVCAAMQHGGPYPATTDSRSTSVGTAAILRFARPVAYQNLPNEMLPEPLRNENPLGILRLVDGQWTRDALA
ncbi:MAG TPA: aldehyde dehydrogenase (NADP(+)) [Fimbriimonas sp.]